MTNPSDDLFEDPSAAAAEPRDAATGPRDAAGQASAALASAPAGPEPPGWSDAERREQFRLAKLSVFNWGTFAGLHEVPVAPDGFLIVGRSGSGKSTLLDAYTALLIPPRWTSFNAAAREGDRSRTDRNLVTYVRGAWADQSSADTGEIAARTLRPGTTWSALAAEYADGAGSVVTLIQCSGSAVTATPPRT
jgi:Uncharacterized protein conserved in bacteria